MLVDSRNYQKPIFPLSVSISAFPPGMYVVVINAEKFMVAEKIIVSVP
jgi:hypothetical protein